jgi:UDP-N-acetylmuramoylalanine-D-glutamate ligase
MKLVRSVNNFDFLCDALADASACASAISEMTEKFVLITCEKSNFSNTKELIKNKCKALFYIGKPDADIMFELRSVVPFIMQTESLEEAIMLASHYKVNDVNKIVFIPGVDSCQGLSANELTEKFKSIVINI